MTKPKEKGIILMDNLKVSNLVINAIIVTTIIIQLHYL